MRATATKPPRRADGTCTACAGGNLCTYCQEEGVRRDRERAAILRRVVAGAHAAEVGRVCARFELESDEGGTREEKAEAMIARGEV